MTPDRPRTFEARAADSYALGVADLAVFRILYSAFVLAAVVPVAAWLPLAPRAFFLPPVGPAALFTSAPPPGVLTALNAALALFAAMLLVGWRTGPASAGTGLTLLALDAWAYSVGKVYHDILLVVTPLVLGFSGWDRALSVDAARGPRPARGRAEPRPLAVLAVLVGVSMFSAGWAKATTGWLDPDLRCAYGHLVGNYVAAGRETWAAGLALRVDSGWLWKAADWSVVALELAFLPAAVHRSSFCLVLAASTLFHLGVLVLFDIPFGVNVLVYGAFVRYTRLPVFRALSGGAALPTPAAAAALAAALGAGLVATLRGKAVDVTLGAPLNVITVWVGAAAGGLYLLQAARDWSRRLGVSRARKK